MKRLRKRFYTILAATASVLLWLVFVLFRMSNVSSDEDLAVDHDPLEDYPPSAVLSGAVDIGELIEDYSNWAQYPPNSRPLRAGHVDVLGFRRIEAPPQPMPTVRAGRIDDSGLACSLQPENHTVVEGERLRIFLSCMRSGAQPDQRLALSIAEIRLDAEAGERRFRPPAPVIGDAGQNGDERAGDRIYTAEFSPRPEDWGDMRLTVNFETGDAPRFMHSLSAHFFSSPVAPARFQGIAGERVSNGSLVVEVQLAVKKPGVYTIEANLFAEDEPVGFARAEEKLSSGLQTIELLYFGKVIRDAGLSGPYRLTGLRGSLNTDVIQAENLAASPAEVERFLNQISDDRPKRMVIPYFTEAYTTQAYSLADFSNREYDSDEKRERLRMLRALAER